MTEELKKNVGWDLIARAMLTAEGSCSYDSDGKNGSIFFLAATFGPDSSPNRRPKRPASSWGFKSSAPNATITLRTNGSACNSTNWPLTLPARNRGRCARRMPRAYKAWSWSRRRAANTRCPAPADPKKTFLTHPRYLDGTSPGANLSDQARRRALANVITSKKNYWFAGPYVNRIWGELMGQSFYQPVDDWAPRRRRFLPLY